MIKIVVIGPESTGKTTLCQELAAYYNATWMPEFAREYIEKLDRPYAMDDVLYIGKKQIELEEHYSEKSDLLFIDTDLIITKVWLLHRYGTCPDWIDEWLEKAKRSLYLLCYPDIEWKYDPVRENPKLRDYFFEWYKKEIEILHVPYFIVKGEGDERKNSCIKKITDTIIML